MCFDVILLCKNELASDLCGFVLSAHLFTRLLQSKVKFQTASDLIRFLFILITINNCEEI
jgi:hypothetical protein